jgi:hypothetical protein
VTTSEIFLGVIATATLIMAIIQVGLIIGGIILAKRVNAAVERIEEAAGPVVERLDQVTTEALASMAAARAQMERLEQTTTDMVERIDQAVHRVQSYVLAPARQGVALLAGARAVVQAFKRLPFSR